MPKMISREEALEMLFDNNEKRPEEQMADELVFDSYGNYVYPSDIQIKEPNLAVGNAFAKFYMV